MGNLYDVLLGLPVPEAVLRVLLFFLFSLHFLFVMFMLGTALISVYYFIHTQWHPRKAEKRWEWSKDVLHTFLAHKSLAVVLGVGALLLMQVGFTIPFLTATNLMGPFWLMIIVLLIIAFLLLDFLGQNWDVRPYLHLAYGVFGLLFLLAVPAIFVAVLITAEQPGWWTQIIHSGYRLPGPLALHWLFRYLHVLGAAVIIGSLFHYFFSKEEQHDKKNALRKWALVGLGFQAPMGLLLYLFLPDQPAPLTNWVLVAGVIFVAGFAWLAWSRRPLRLASAVPVLTLVFLTMLLTRQTIQDRNLAPLMSEVRQNKETYQTSISPFLDQGIQTYQTNFDAVYDRGEVIYPRSCGFCHGEQADGAGIEAAGLVVAPEKLAHIRAHRDYLHAQMIQGVPGSAMPFFTVFTREKLGSTLDYLDEQHGIFEPPDNIPVSISNQTLIEAQRAYSLTCANCHGQNGKGGTAVSANYAPPVPDFNRYTLLSDYMFDVITNGYPGTMMVAFNEYPEEVRWGLVKVVQGFYDQK